MRLQVWQIILGGFLALAALGWVLKATGLAPKQKTSEATAAMYIGGTVAVEMANGGAVKPTSERVEALAREAATKTGITDSLERSKFVDDFEHGFWIGWKTATR